MRTPETEESVFIAPDNTAQIVLSFDDNRLASTLFGQYGQNLALIERRLAVVANSRGNQVTVEGSREACDQARRVLESLYDRLKRGDDLVQGDVEGTIRQALSQGSLFDFDPTTPRQNFEEINLAWIASHYHSAIFAQAGEQHFHLHCCRVLGFVQNNRGVRQRTAAHECKRCDLDFAGLQRPFDDPWIHQIVKRVIDRPQVRIDLLPHVAWKKAEAFASFHRWAR